MKNLAQKIVKKLIKNKLTITCAESCTGGLLSKLITDIPGASNCFKGSVIAYSNEIKQGVLKVKEQTLLKYGAVSEKCAKEMAVGVRQSFKTNIGISITGITGPTGGTKNKPVGTIFLALSTKKSVISLKFLSKNNKRDKNRAMSAKMALLMIDEVLSKPSPIKKSR